jgi:choline-sulfatase
MEMQTELKNKNLLIIISDEHRKDAMGCVGHPLVKTPNLDKLAARGCLFENAYTPSPMCVPTRAAIACGNYVHNIGYWDSATPYDGSIRSWMRQLREAGVDVASIGKLHFRSAEDDNGFSEELVPMHVVGGVGWAVGLLRENPPPYDSAIELAADVGIGETSYTNYDLEITKTAEDWLHDKRDTEAPWAAFVSLVSPHYPLSAPEEFYKLYDPANMDLPIGYDASQRPTHPELKNISSFFNYDEYFDEQKIREAKCAYYGLTSFMDHCLGRVLQDLEESGQAANTTVIYISDHGDMMGDMGFWTKQVMYDASAGVPMIMAGPGIAEGRRVKTGTSLVDIAATALDALSISHDVNSEALPGRSLIDIANQPDDPERTIFSEYHDGGSTTGTFMVRWDEWKYVHYVGASPQLFNLANDPKELTDLAIEKSKESHISNALKEGQRRLYEICNPDEVNDRCFADQRKRIEELGGEEACLNAYVFNHTPTPSEQNRE